MTENAESKEGKRKWGRRVVRLAYFLLTLYLVCATFTNKDESGNLAAGLSIWKYGRVDLYSVNPPLVKAVAAVRAVGGIGAIAVSVGIAKADNVFFHFTTSGREAATAD